MENNKGNVTSDTLDKKCPQDTDEPSEPTVNLMFTGQDYVQPNTLLSVGQ